MFKCFPILWLSGSFFIENQYPDEAKREEIANACNSVIQKPGTEMLQTVLRPVLLTNVWKCDLMNWFVRRWIGGMPLIKKNNKYKQLTFVTVLFYCMSVIVNKWKHKTKISQFLWTHQQNSNVVNVVLCWGSPLLCRHVLTSVILCT